MLAGLPDRDLDLDTDLDLDFVEVANLSFASFESLFTHIFVKNQLTTIFQAFKIRNRALKNACFEIPRFQIGIF